MSGPTVMLSLGPNNDIPLEDDDQCNSTNNIPVKANACYSTVAADVPLEVNECCGRANTLIKANECYGTSTSDSYTEIKEVASPDYDYIV